MKVLILYRPNSEHGRVVEDFARDYEHNGHSGRIEMFSVDTREGSALASLYDVMQYPTLMVTRDDGVLLRSWEGEALPLQNEVASYAFS